jgi:FAD/FMN-containing dehydrogenase
MGQSTSSPLQDCLTKAVGGSNVAFQSNVFYQTTDVKRYNLDINVNPLAITYPSTNQQVASVISCASANKAKVQARSGGHSYGNFALGGGDTSTVVVDLNKFQQFNMDQQSWIATVGAGTLLADVTDKMQQYGRAMAHGTCPQVGIGGHATIGKSPYAYRAMNHANVIV